MACGLLYDIGQQYVGVCDSKNTICGVVGLSWMVHSKKKIWCRACLHRGLRAVSFVLLFFCCLAVSAVSNGHAAEVTLAWSPNTEPDLAGYRLFQRKSGEVYDYGNPAWEGWIESDDPGQTLVDPDNPTCTISVDDHCVSCFVVRAFNGSGHESGDSNEACWTPPNVQPLALAGPDQTVYEGAAVTLDGSNSYDPDGATILFSWSQVAGTAVVLSGASSMHPAFTAPFVGPAGDQLVFELEVTDEGGLTDTDEVIVTVVSVDDPPLLTELSISGSGSVPENSTASYSAWAAFSDGSSRDVTDDSNWSENSSYAAISADGVLTTSEVPGDRYVTVTAYYAFGGVTETAQKTVNILDVPPPPSGNRPPDTPYIVSPYDGRKDVVLNPELNVGPFTDPDGDAHEGTEWQVAVDDSFNPDTLVFAPFIAPPDLWLTALPVPWGVLEEGRPYFWRVRFFDASSNSAWSETSAFTTLFSNDDADGNGIADYQEVDRTVDLDGNGIPDVDEPHRIKCVNTVVGNAQMGVKKGRNVETIDMVKSLDPAQLPYSDQAPDEMPLGLIGFRVTVAHPGADAEVTIYFSDPAPEGAAWCKYDAVNGWHVDGLKVVSVVGSDRKSVTLYLTDGGYGDADGVANGVIVDPGGMGLSYAPPTGPGSQPAVAGGGGGGGCFISSLMGEPKLFE